MEFHLPNGKCSFFVTGSSIAESAIEHLNEVMLEGGHKNISRIDETDINGIKGAKILYDDNDFNITKYVFEMANRTNNALLSVLFKISNDATEKDVFEFEVVKRVFLDSIRIYDNTCFADCIEGIAKECSESRRSSSKDEENCAIKNEALLILQEALKLQNKHLSTSWIQRKFKMGYGKSAKIIDWLEDNGYVQSYQNMRNEGLSGRRILVSESDLN